MHASQKLVAGVLLLAGISGGCFRTEYVYVDPYGNEIRSSSRAKVTVQLSSAMTPIDDSNAQIGHWSSPVGEWGYGDHIELMLNGQTERGENFSRTTFATRSRSEGMTGWSSEGPVSFSIKGGPGSIKFDGTMQNKHAEGNVTAVIDPGYRKELAELTGTTLTPLTALEMIIRDLPIAYVREMRQAGYKFNVDDLIRLRRSGVDVEYATAAVGNGKEKLSAEQIISLRRRGIDTETLRKLRQ